MGKLSVFQVRPEGVACKEAVPSDELAHWAWSYAVQPEVVLIEPDRDKRQANVSVLVEQLEELVPSPAERRRLGKMVAATPGYTSRPGSDC